MMGAMNEQLRAAQEPIGWGPTLLVLGIILIVFAVGAFIAVASRKRAEKGAERGFVDKHYARAANLIPETDARVRGLHSPLCPPHAVQEWEATRARFEQESSREATEQVLAAHANALYLQGIEQGDLRLRAQAVNELVSEARQFGSDQLARHVAGLRAKVADPEFCAEYARAASALGPASRQWCDREFNKLMSLRQVGRKADPDVPSPGITSREYRPGSGLGGFVPIGAIWEQYCVGMGSYDVAQTVNLHPAATGRVYRRWLRGEVAP